jgi:hypothetical protein
MRALSLTQPWATLVAFGAKLIETRSWSTAYRGQIAIHAAKAFPSEARRLCGRFPFSEVLTRHGVLRTSELPLGAIIATATLADCVRFTASLDAVLAVSKGRTAHEEAFGDFTPGRYGFMLRRVQRLATPIPCRGALGLWEVPDEIQTKLGRPEDE